jgi:diacylglycerol kinase family enzyme
MEIDVAEVNGRLFLCVCVMGFFAEVAAGTDAHRGRPWWHKSMWMAHRMARSFWEYPSMQLQFDDDCGEMARTPVRTRFAAVANNEYLEEPGIILRKKALDEGVLGVYVSSHETIAQVIRGSVAFFAGAMTSDPAFSAHRCPGLRVRPRNRRRIRVMIDGEIVKLKSPLAFRSHPASLRVLHCVSNG